MAKVTYREKPVSYVGYDVIIECSLSMAAAIRGFLGGGSTSMRAHIKSNGSEPCYSRYVELNPELETIELANEMSAVIRPLMERR